MLPVDRRNGGAKAHLQAPDSESTDGPPGILGGGTVAAGKDTKRTELLSDPVQGIGIQPYGTQEVRRLGGGQLRGTAAAQILASTYRPGPSIDFGDFAARIHRPGTGAAFFEGSKNELLERVREGWASRKPGIGQTGLDKVILVPFSDPGAFRSNSVALHPDVKLTATFQSRRSHEMPFIKVRAVADAEPAEAACAVIYSRDALLAHGEEPSGDGDWEIVKIIAGPTIDEPMDPYTMARNLLGLPGGNPDVTYTAEQFAEAVVHWAGRALRAGDPKKKKKGHGAGAEPTVQAGRQSPSSSPPSKFQAHLKAQAGAPSLSFDASALGIEHWTGEPKALLQRIQADWRSAVVQGDGSILVPMSNVEGFRGVVAPLESGDRLSAFFEPDGPGGLPAVEVRVHKEAPAARQASVTLTPTPGGGFEVQSIRASADPDRPLHPMELARDVLAGRRPDLTAFDFARAVEYWARHARVAFS